MRKHIVFVQAIFFVTNIILVGNAAKKNAKASQSNQETMFADVIKNISRVNHVLQELITNYKRLQDIYKSEEYIDDYSYDDEIDEVYKERAIQEKTDKKRKRKPRVDTSPSPKNNEFPATEMIWSDEKPNKSEGADEDTTVNDNRMPGIEELQIKSSSKDTTTESDSGEATSPTSIRDSKPEIIFVDTHINTQDNIEDKKTSPKSRYAKVNDYSSAVNKQSTATENMKAHSYIEPKMFMRQRNTSEFIESNPSTLEQKTNVSNIELHMETDTSEESKSGERRNGNTSNVNASSSHRKTAIVIVAKNSKGVQDTKTSREDEEGLAKDLFQTDVLRTAYADACLKVAIRKCYKGCKGALDSACNFYVCKGTMQDKFREHAKTGCLKEFQKETVTRTNTGQNMDITRSGIVQAACMYEVKSTEQEALRNNIQLAPDTNRANLNILRDDYIKECQKLAAMRCVGACTFALNLTCISTQCIKGLENKLKKTCKTHCKRAYKPIRDAKYHSSRSKSCSTSSDCSDSSYYSDSSLDTDSSEYSTSDSSSDSSSHYSSDDSDD